MPLPGNATRWATVEQTKKNNMLFTCSLGPSAAGLDQRWWVRMEEASFAIATQSVTPVANQRI